MFWHAHIVVKLVMLGLLAASVWCWAIIIDKTLLFSRTRRSMDRFEEVFWSGQSLEELYRALADRPTTSMASVFVAAMREWKRSFEGPNRAVMGLTQRIDKVLDVTIQREVERLESKLLVLATIGSSAPFIGLFGTVWGIMTSFRAIAASRTHRSPSSRQASPRRCSRRPLASSPRSRPSSPTTSSRRKPPNSRRASRASPMSSRRSCRAKSTSASRPEEADPWP